MATLCCFLIAGRVRGIWAWRGGLVSGEWLNGRRGVIVDARYRMWRKAQGVFSQ